MHHRLTLYLTAFAILGGCTTPYVKYSILTTPSTDFNDEGLSFRIPRSQISIAKKAGALGATFIDTVIDPVPTGSTPIPLPLNDKSNYFYTLDYKQPDPTGFTNNTFNALIKEGSLSAWPIPTCGTATVTVYVADDTLSLPDFSVTATPTELDYPASFGQKANNNSTLYSISGIDDLVSTTALKITYVPNTKLVQSVGTTVTDHVVDDIKTLSVLATAAAGFAAAGGGVPPVTKGTNLFPKANFTIKVADNRVLQAMSFPSNGTITMNSICGADRTDAGTGGLAAITTGLSQIMTATQSAYAAWNKAPTTAKAP